MKVSTALNVSDTPIGVAEFINLTVQVEKEVFLKSLESIGSILTRQGYRVDSSVLERAIPLFLGYYCSDMLDTLGYSDNWMVANEEKIPDLLKAYLGAL